jgi:hypothetical protein
MSLDSPAIASRIRSRGLGHWPRERGYAMRLLFLALLLGLIAVTRTVAAPQQLPASNKSSATTRTD